MIKNNSKNKKAGPRNLPKIEDPALQQEKNGNRGIDNWTRLIIQAEKSYKTFEIATFTKSREKKRNENYSEDRKLRIFGRWSILINRGLA